MNSHVMLHLKELFQYDGIKIENKGCLKVQKFAVSKILNLRIHLILLSSIQEFLIQGVRNISFCYF